MIECDLLDSAIICIGRTGIAITDNRSRMGGVCSVGEEILLFVVVLAILYIARPQRGRDFRND